MICLVSNDILARTVLLVCNGVLVCTDVLVST